jgi:hypothetical protein
MREGRRGATATGRRGRGHARRKSISSHMRNGVLLRANDYIDASGCATRVQSLFRP